MLTITCLLPPPLGPSGQQEVGPEQTRRELAEGLRLLRRWGQASPGFLIVGFWIP